MTKLTPHQVGHGYDTFADLLTMELAAEPEELAWRASTLVKGPVSLPIRLHG